MPQEKSAIEYSAQQAIHEIRELRRANEILTAKVQVMDLFELVLKTRPEYQSQGASVDIMWQLQRDLDDMNAVKSNTESA